MSCPQLRWLLLFFHLLHSPWFSLSKIVTLNATFFHLHDMELMSNESSHSRSFLDIVPHHSRTVISDDDKLKWAFFRRKRQVIAGRWHHWRTNVIPYKIAGGDATFRRFILDGIRMWEKDTCLRFVQNRRSRQAIIYMLEHGDSCFTEYIGKTDRRQEIIIGRECAEDYVVAHETGHVLGFWHTHQRPDRSQHIEINWDNVLEDAALSFIPYRRMLRTFQIYGMPTMNIPYDYGSLMHYHAFAHSKRNLDYTIIPNKIRYVTTMGTEQLAFLDLKVINDLYCADACLRSSRLTCRNGGYPDPVNCERCKCPQGLGGKLCDRLKPSHCGRELTATRSWKKLESPAGKQNRDCYWRIRSKGRIRFRLIDGDFPCTFGCHSYVEIKYKSDLRLTGFRNCCVRPKNDLVSEENQILVIFHPNGNSAHFTLRYIGE